MIQGMRLVIFDVDGTLTDTNEVDGICFQRALQEEFGLPMISRKWASYQHTTDVGIATEVLGAYWNRVPSTAELKRTQNRFLTLLKQAHRSHPDHFREIPGAREILNYLKQEGTWKVAIATGCWAESALFKLQNAGIHVDLPFASCEESISRDVIVSRAIEKAKFYYDCREFSCTVFVGDGAWDVTTANTLGIGFIGISPAEKQSLLKNAGAKFICRSFSPTSRFLTYLNEWSCYATSNRSLSV